jgi:hypothetical protein
VPPHPGDHERDDPHRHGAHDRLERLLPALRQLLVDELERDADRDAQPHGGDDADPHRAQRVAAALLAEEGGDDADDERGLDAFAQADDEGGQHGGGAPPGRG